MMTHYDINWMTKKFDNGETLKFLFFWGNTNKYDEQIGKFCFSQWFDSPFTVDNVTYKTAEHWMMANKALLFGDNIAFDKIVNAETPKLAKEFGREVLGYNEHIWDKNKFEIVKLGNIHKFNQNPSYADYLIKTENRIIVEASPVDAIWGIGLSQDSKDIDNIYAWRGLNLLGFVLMEVRDFMKEFGHFKPIQSTLLPPWKTYPKIDSRDMFWRMGKGEEYLDTFNIFYQSLSDRDKLIYKMTNPNPYDWGDFYGT